MRQRLNWGYLFSIATAGAWGIAAVIIRKGISEGASPLGGAVVSLFCGSVILALMNVGHPGGVTRHQGWALTLFLIWRSAQKRG